MSDQTQSERALDRIAPGEQAITEAVFFDGPRGVALFADLFAGAYCCWRKRKPIGARVVFDVDYDHGTDDPAKIYLAAVTVVRAITQREAESIAHRLCPDETLARGHWYEVSPE
jgi:hypothetical protein